MTPEHDYGGIVEAARKSEGALATLRAYAETHPCPICGKGLEVPEGRAELFCVSTRWPVYSATRAALAGSTGGDHAA